MNKLFSFSVSLLGSSSFALASIPFGIGPSTAQEAKTTQGSAADLGVMSISLKDAIQPNFGFQGALQGAGTPNQSGIGGFLPLAIGDNSVFFLDAQANANFADFNEYSSIINTKVAGTTISTSSRLGYRWLNKNRSWMFGVNAGYDSRPMATGGTDNGVYVTNSRSVFFQQVALNLEAVSNKWFTSAYLLYPIGEYGFNKTPALINSFYGADSVMTVGTNIGYNLTPNLKASIGYYYSEGDAGEANGNSVKGRLEYNIANGLITGINLAYDPAYSKGYSSDEFYKTLNLSADLKWRFGANGYGAPSIRNQQPVVMPVIQALSASPENRDVRVHDCSFISFWSGGCNKKMRQAFVKVGDKIGDFALNQVPSKFCVSLGEKGILGLRNLCGNVFADNQLLAKQRQFERAVADAGGDTYLVCSRDFTFQHSHTQKEHGCRTNPLWGAGNDQYLEFKNRMKGWF